MKKLVLVSVLILQFYNTPQILAQTDTLFDIFPLHKNLVYKYEYHRNHYGNDPTVVVDGFVNIIVIQDVIDGDSLKIWQVEERNQLTRTIVNGFYGDTTIVQNDSIFFNIRESLIGNHLITIPSVIIFEDQDFGCGWNTHSPWSNISVERYSSDSSLTQMLSGGSGVFNYDTIYYSQSVGLINRLWENEWVGTSLWIDILSVNQIGEPIVGILKETKFPTEFLLNQNYPNPFNPSTKISWQAPESGWQTLKVYDVLGNEVATLVNEYRSAGSYEIEFNPASSIKHPASGIYFYQLQAGDYLETRKMILLK